MPVIKRCPYCLAAQPFFGLVNQRLRAGEDGILVCTACGSTISSSGGARVPLLLGGSGMAGYLLGRLLHEVAEARIAAVAAGVGIAVSLFLIGAYVTAPIRDA